MKCYFCGKEINDEKIVYHINNTCLKMLNEENKLKVFYEKHLGVEKINKIIDLYIKKGYSLVELENIFGLARKELERIICSHGFSIRGIKESCLLERRQKRYAETCLKKFGVDNASKNNEIKDKKCKTFIAHYGVDNVRKSKEFKDYYKTIMKERYGKGSLPNIYGNKTKWWAQFDKEERKEKIKQWGTVEGWCNFWKNACEEEKERIIRKRAETLEKNGYTNKYSSSLEERIAVLLNELDIKFCRQWFIGRHSFDFLLFDSKLILEVHGDFWHCNPLKYKENDIVKFKKESIKAKQIWEKDEYKKRLVEQSGFKYICIWESEIRSMDNEELKKWLENENIINQKHKEN